MTKAPPAARDVAFVFQQYSLYPHLSVYDNLAFPLRSPLRPMIETEIRTRVTEIARLLRIDDKLQNSATRLSGGQMQRVAIGRALVRKPAIYLMDEPLSSLDAKLRSELRLELKRIQKDLGATILYVTHDQIEAMTMADHIGVLDSGRLVQVGSPREIYEDPASTYVATRLGSPAINLLPRALFPGVPAPAPTTTFGARTENIRLKRANGHAQGKIRWIEHLGDQNHLHIEMGGQNSSPWSIRTRRWKSAPKWRSSSRVRSGSMPTATASAREEGLRVMDSATQRKLIETVAKRVIAAADELTTLDQAIGDGDHGLNMKRGMEAVLADLDKIAGQPLPEALKTAGMALVMKVGGASGPLYGTLCMDARQGAAGQSHPR